MLVLWFTIGYWHGGSFNFIIGSGLLHWGYIVFGELAEPLFVKMRGFFGIRAGCRWFLWLQRLRTFVLVMFGLVFFRNASVVDAVRMLGRGFSAFNPQIFVDKTLFSFGLDWVECTVLLVSLLLMEWVTIQQQKGWLRERLEKKPLLIRWMVLYALLFYVILLGQYGPGYSASEFIYQNFKV